MTQEEHNKFSQLFTDILTYSGIQHVNESNGEAYVVYNNSGIVFSITFNKSRNSYILGDCLLLKSKYKQYGLSADAVPDHKELFETVAFAYKTQQLAIRAQKDFNILYKDMLINSDVIYDMHGDFETYTVENSGVPGYSIGYNKKTRKYELTKHELINTFYTICGIPATRTPDCAYLYKIAKDYYMAQAAIDSIQHLYD